MAITLIFRRPLQNIAFVLMLADFSVKAEVVEPPIVIAALPNEFVGSWRVKSVRINMQDGRRRGLEFNDPELIGRRFRFSDQEIAYNTLGESHCIKPTAFKWIGEANKLLELTMGKKGLEEPYKLATVDEFWLPLTGNKIVEAFILTCADGRVGPRASLELPYPLNTKYFCTWVVFFNKDEMAMKWYDDTILLLRRETNSAHQN